MAVSLVAHQDGQRAGTGAASLGTLAQHSPHPGAILECLELVCLCALVHVCACTYACVCDVARVHVSVYAGWHVEIREWH